MTGPGGDPAAQVALSSALARGTLPITSVCNFACIFCSNHQNPPGVRTFRFPHRPLADIRHDIGLLPRTGRIVVGEAATRIDEGEPLLHPEFDQILADVRAARPQAELVVTTNGSLLDRRRIEIIASLAPVSVNLSLNLVTADARRRWLGDRNPGRAPEAAKLLSEYGIPWHGSLVGMPHITGWDEIARTLHFLSENGALTARLFLPGYTHLAPDDLRFGDDLWPELTDFGRRMSRSLGMPVTAEPPRPRDLSGTIAGVIKGSPAEAAGLQAGDNIIDVGNADGYCGRPRCRVEAHRMVGALSGPCQLTVERAGMPKGYRISADTPSPRLRTGVVPYGARGIVVDYDIDPDQVERAAALISRARGKTWILTGQLAAPLVKMALGWWTEYSETRVIAVANRFFGGSIVAAGLLTTDDIIAAGQAALAEAAATGSDRPSLVLVPGLPFDERGHDLVGRSYLDISEALGVPVELIE